MVDIQPTTQPISDDQELAKVLAGVTQEGDNASMQYEETPAANAPQAQAQQNQDQGVQPNEQMQAPAQTDNLAAQPSYAQGNNPVQQADNVSADRSQAEVDSELRPIKTDAINELRPLVDKLELPPEEKFDTFLLLIRSTDDKTLIAPAHAAAKDIQDETKRAQALLTIIKEIDYLSRQ